MKIPLFDAHCDTISALYEKNEPLLQNKLHIDLKRAAKYRPYAQFFALFGIVAGPSPGTSWATGAECFETLYSLFSREIAANQDLITLCRGAREARAAAKQGKCAAFLSVEGAELLECSPERLEAAWHRGVRAVTLTWNFENALSGSNAEGQDKGLTPLGVQFVRRCQEIGVLVDVSHLSDPGFWDVMAIAEKPVVATHSNARALCRHSRNLTDDMFLALKGTGGVAGLNLYAEFVGGRPDMNGLICHLEHFLALSGEKHVAFGADLDGCDRLPEGICGIEDMEKLYGALQKRNFSEALIHDLFYNNLMRVVEDVCDM